MQHTGLDSIMLNSRARLWPIPGWGFNFLHVSVHLCQLCRQLVLWSLLQRYLLPGLVAIWRVFEQIVFLLLCFENYIFAIVSFQGKHYIFYGLTFQNAKEAINETSLQLTFGVFFFCHMQFFNEILRYIPISSAVIFIANIITDVRSLP